MALCKKSFIFQLCLVDFSTGLHKLAGPDELRSSSEERQVNRLLVSDWLIEGRHREQH